MTQFYIGVVVGLFLQATVGTLISVNIERFLARGEGTPAGPS
jgi:hypothetical protein